MRPSQAEMKAIEAELRAIRADSSVSLLDPASPVPTSPSSTSIAPVISPKIERTKAADANSTTAHSTTPKKRSVECFPIVENNLSGQSQRLTQTSAQSRSNTEQRTDLNRTNLNRSIQRQTRFARPTQPHSQQAAVRQMLAEKAHQINLLSTQQEAVILELITLSEQIESASAVCETAEVPHVADAAGTLVLTSRAIELPLEERRTRRTRRNHLMLASTGAVWQGTWGLLGGLGKIASFLLSSLGLLEQKPRRTYPPADDYGSDRQVSDQSSQRRAGRRASGRRTAETFSFQEAVILVLGSAMLRVGLDLLVASYPMLWVPSLLVMLAPAAIAIYRSTLLPQTGFIWGYRLFSLMIGLLLGGRL